MTFVPAWISCSYLELQYYANPKHQQLIKPHLHIETNPYGSDNMLAAGGRGVFYSRHLGRRKSSGGPCTQRNSPFTEKRALSSCHGWQGKCQGLFLSSCVTLSNEETLYILSGILCRFFFTLLRTISLLENHVHAVSVRCLEDILCEVVFKHCGVTTFQCGLDKSRRLCNHLQYPPSDVAS